MKTFFSQDPERLRSHSFPDEIRSRSGGQGSDPDSQIFFQSFEIISLFPYGLRFVEFEETQKFSVQEPIVRTDFWKIIIIFKAVTLC